MVDLDRNRPVRPAKLKADVNISASTVGPDIVDPGQNSQRFTQRNRSMLFDANPNVQTLRTKRLTWPRPV